MDGRGSPTFRLTGHPAGATFRAGISVAYRHVWKGRGQKAVAELVELLARGYVTDQRDLMQLDQRIHRSLYRATRNTFLEATLERYFNLSLRLWYLVLDREVRLREAVDEHVDLLQAVLAGDGQRAEDIMRRHVPGFEREIRKVRGAG